VNAFGIALTDGAFVASDLTETGKADCDKGIRDLGLSHHRDWLRE